MYTVPYIALLMKCVGMHVFEYTPLKKQLSLVKLYQVPKHGKGYHSMTLEVYAS